MDPTKLPTDNLYKFMAIAGLLIIAVSTIFWWQQAHVLEESISQTSTEMAQLNSKMTELDHRMEMLGPLMNTQDLLQKTIDTAISDFKKDTEAFHTKQLTQRELEERYLNYQKIVSTAQASLAENRPRFEAVVKESEQLQLNRDLLKVQETKKDLARTNFELATQVLITGMLVGAVISLAGFILWYFKLQRHLDMAVAKGSNPS